MAGRQQVEAAEPAPSVVDAEGNDVAFDEQALADASIQGSAHAFEELYTHYFPKVRGFCLRKTSDPALAEDIAQEAFVRAFERIDQFGGPKHFGGWVGTIAANLITDHYRRKRNTEVSLDAKEDAADRGPSYEIDPIRNIQRDDTSRLVRIALDKLEPRQREALVMHEIKGMTCAAVGEQLGISEVAAESLLARARRRLRKEITAKAAPADLFGFGGLGLLPALLRVWRRTKDAVGRRADAVHATAVRSVESAGSNLVPSLDAAKALVVVVGAALAIQAAGAVAPPAAQVTPDDTVTTGDRAPLIAPVGDGSSTTDPLDGIETDIEITDGSAGASAEGTLEVPGVPGTEEPGPMLDYRIDVTIDDSTQQLTGHILVQDTDGSELLDTGDLDLTTP